MKVSVLIPTHDRAERVLRVVESLDALIRVSGVEIETIVVANACTDATVHEVRGQADRTRIGLRVVEEPRPGLNPARNAGMAGATGEVLAFLDDDVWVEPSWLSGLVESVRGGARLIAGQTSLWWEVVDRPDWLSANADRLLTRLELGVEPLPLHDESPFVGANFALHREVYDSVGEFHPYLDRAGSDLLSGGDTEYVRRAFQRGFTGVYSPDMAVRHWVAPERVTRRYLRGVAAGRGREQAALALLAGDVRLGSLALLAVKQMILGSIRQGRALARRDPSAAVDAALLRQRGLGVLQVLASPRSRSRFEPAPGA